MADAMNPNTNADFREQLSRYEERMHPRYELYFDGSKLTLKENGKPIVSWPGVSGKAGTQGPENQSYRDRGPLPQGGYRAKVNEMQQYEDTSAWDRIKGLGGGGKWPGGTTAWATTESGWNRTPTPRRSGVTIFRSMAACSRDRQAASISPAKWTTSPI
jgi:hypothetical protein